MQTELLRYLPEWFRQVLDFRVLLDAEQPEFEALDRGLSQVRDNFYIQTGDAGALRQMERVLGIAPDLSAESLEFRRTRVLNRMSIQPPFSLRFLYGKLDQLAGAGRWAVRVDYPGYGLYVSVMESIATPREILTTLDIVKPCHIERFLEVRILGTVLEEQNEGHLRRFGVRARVYERGNGMIRLDGVRRLDGAWKLDAMLDLWPRLHRLTVSARDKHMFGSSAGVRYGAEVRTEENGQFSGFGVRGAALEKLEVGLSGLGLGVEVRNYEAVRGAVTVNSMWRLDGAWNLDGVRKLDAGIVRSEL